MNPRQQNSAEPRGAIVEVAGLTLHYLDWGRDSPGGPTCVLLHGSTGNAHLWDHLARRLSRRIRTIALDLRGHGGSEWADPPAYKLGDYTGDLALFIEKLGLSSVIFVAHSMSVYHAIRYGLK